MENHTIQYRHDGILFTVKASKYYNILEMIEKLTTFSEEEAETMARVYILENLEYKSTAIKQIENYREVA